MPVSASGLLRYPYEAITQNTDYLQIRIFHYAPKTGENVNSFTAGPTESGQALDVSNYVSNKAKVLDENGVIILPMPSNIQDTNSVSYDNDSLNAITAAGFNLTEQVMKGVDITNFDKTSKTGQAALANIRRFFSNNDLQGLATKALAANAVNVFGANVSLNQLLARSEGKILNPNMELLFNNVTLRTFRFSFKFAPRDPNEATVVKSIIRTLKKNMAAKKEGDIFLQTPNVFKLTYRKGNQNHPFLHRFKDCALSDMNIQYTGDNVYATYADGTPVSMIMNLTFKEMMPIYSDDYNETEPGEGSGTSPGEFNDSQLIYGVNQNTSKHVEGVGF